MSNQEQNQGQNGKKKKNRGLSFAIVAFIGSAILNLSLPGMFFTVLGAYGIGKLVGVMSTPLDTTTHNKQDIKRQKPQDVPLSGDTEADSVISKGKEMLAQIREANLAIPDPHLSNQMDQLEDLCIQLFTTVAEKPGKATQLRKFMNYYLPTTLKMINSYRTMQDRGVSSSDLAEARRTLSRGMDMILVACQKQLDNLYKDTMLDVSSDMDVLEQMRRLRMPQPRPRLRLQRMHGPRQPHSCARTAACPYCIHRTRTLKKTSQVIIIKRKHGKRV